MSAALLYNNVYPTHNTRSVMVRATTSQAGIACWINHSRTTSLMFISTGTRSAACGKLFLLRICCCSAQQSIIQYCIVNCIILCWAEQQHILNKNSFPQAALRVPVCRSLHVTLIMAIFVIFYYHIKGTGSRSNHQKIGDFILASLYDHIWCKRVHRLELQMFFNFCAAHLPVRLDIETKFPYFLFLTWLSVIRNREFRLYI